MSDLPGLSLIGDAMLSRGGRLVYVLNDGDGWIIMRQLADGSHERVPGIECRTEENGGFDVAVRDAVYVLSNDPFALERYWSDIAGTEQDTRFHRKMA